MTNFKRNPATMPSQFLLFPDPLDPFADGGYGYLYNWSAAIHSLITSSGDWRLGTSISPISDLANDWGYIRQRTNIAIGVDNSVYAGIAVSTCRYKNPAEPFDPCYTTVHPYWYQNPIEGLVNPQQDIFNLRLLPGGYYLEGKGFRNVSWGLGYWMGYTEDTQYWRQGPNYISAYSTGGYTMFYWFGHIPDENTKNFHHIRLVRYKTKDEDHLNDGDFASDYVGNDGKSYPTVCIGTRVVTATNLKETKLRNNDDILEASSSDIENESTKTTPKYCAYNFNEAWV